MSKSLSELRDMAVERGIRAGKARRMLRQELLGILGMVAHYGLRYRLVDQSTGEVTEWNSVNKIRKRCGITKKNFLYHMRRNKPLKVNGKSYLITRICC